MHLREVYWQDDVLDTLYWLRQAVGLLLGFIWGIVPITGFIAFLV